MAVGAPGGVDAVERSGGIRLEIPCDAGYVSLVRMLVSSITFERRDIDDERLEDLVLAVSEACTRAVETCARTGRDVPLVVDWQEDDTGCTVVVHDAALEAEVGQLSGGTVPRDVGDFTDPGLAAVEGDLSLPLIKSLVDDLRLEATGSTALLAMRMLCGPAPKRPEEI